MCDKSCLTLSPLILSIVILITTVNGETCEQVDGKTLLKGCALLKGVSIISQGRTVVNDSNCDVLLPKLIFAKEPNIIFLKADTKKQYTVMVVDPDAPNHTAGNFYLHMIKSNIEGAYLMKGDTTSGLEVKEYVGPAPPVATTNHRYLFLVYEQSSKEIKPVAPETRARFDLSAWTRNLPICGPVAGVEFKTRFDL